eukprot:384293-Pleurochrysis_carterae.AAC.1
MLGQLMWACVSTAPLCSRARVRACLQACVRASERVCMGVAHILRPRCSSTHKQELASTDHAYCVSADASKGEFGRRLS